MAMAELLADVNRLSSFGLKSTLTDILTVVLLFKLALFEYMYLQCLCLHQINSESQTGTGSRTTLKALKRSEQLLCNTSHPPLKVRLLANWWGQDSKPCEPLLFSEKAVCFLFWSKAVGPWLSYDLLDPLFIPFLTLFICWSFLFLHVLLPQFDLW